MSIINQSMTYDDCDDENGDNDDDDDVNDCNSRNENDDGYDDDYDCKAVLLLTFQYNLKMHFLQ